MEGEELNFAVKPPAFLTAQELFPALSCAREIEMLPIETRCKANYGL